jgi:hypothetical protein
MLCKIWGVHGGDYEECRLLGYKNPVRTSLEIRYFLATEPRRLMLCKICGFHGGDWRMPPSGMYCRVALVSTDVSEKYIVSIIRVKRISELGKLVVTSKTFLLSRWFFPPWWWRRYVPPKCQFLQDPYGTISQKTVFLILSNLGRNRLRWRSVRRWSVSSQGTVQNDNRSCKWF